jgi:hypothetical protein
MSRSAGPDRFICFPRELGTAAWRNSFLICCDSGTNPFLDYARWDASSITASAANKLNPRYPRLESHLEIAYNGADGFRSI